MKKDPRVDAYIDKAKPFAKPILNKLRSLIHQACPEVTETIKWGMPSFEYKGPLCGMASFKEHAAFGFWKHPLIKDPDRLLEKSKNNGGEAMGNLGCLKTVSDIPPGNKMAGFIKQAVTLNELGIKLPSKPKTIKDPLPLHPDFKKALQKNRDAREIFNEFPPSQKREYIEWINDAKQDATRERRVKTAIEWIEDGKSRNWKYETKSKKRV